LQISNGLPNEQNIALAKFGSPKIEGGVVMHFKKKSFEIVSISNAYHSLFL